MIDSMLNSFFLGAIVGGIFAQFNFPIPAPASWIGVTGIIGIVAGYKFILWL